MFFAKDAVESSQAYQFLQSKVLEEGLGFVKVGADWHEIEEICASTKKKYLGEHFHRSVNTTPPDEGFWIAVVDREGEVIATVAARLQRTGGWTLRRYWAEYIPRAYTAADGGAVELASEQSVFADQIRGNVAYIGEGWVSEAWAGHKLSVTLVQMAAVLAYGLWRPDYLYGWMRPRHALGGMAIKWGFTECHPAALRFSKPPAGGDLEELFFVGTSARAARDLISRLAERFRGLASSR